ncbi:hypothetical protein KAFR_0G00700 [Kazachstania africana CBS 2517]|uniref:Phosphatidic acid phosphatase type 2/haloperoxidase domain-containing protein n=1 Tax=Kazachstania africana (strain ATCC 22294 / BCRC 22015 / CBS 2517 / CECT 1963 / NBRC 1671 / NRRL Y-8276) TaxID=1071382 RepID=H2AXK3_KAZAF|nr:hypothetical protein KAFR_0G00700 [Kazachstania africana CBS 2517]CCF59103.1 hypothetical protein KAFR_0G00700 [Kazachstania africana CBS 2517]
MSDTIELTAVRPDVGVSYVGTAVRGEAPLIDPGNHPAEHFKSRMSPTRFKVRQYLSRFTDTQSEKLAEWQRKHSSPFRDVFFPYTALLGSHMFYVLCLPLPAWFGYYELTRDLVYILGYSIYVSGFLKDYCCLPRPRAPPVKRVSLSAYTTKEYGAPSSHSANAAGATLYFLWQISITDSISLESKIGLSLVIFTYYWTLVLGRIYCGMHGLLDLISGTLCGAACFIVRMGLKHYFADFKSGEYFWFPFVSIACGLLLLFKHVRPIDECPCFGDSVAFIGVASGYEIGDWFVQKFFSHRVCGTIAADGYKVLLRPLVAVPMILIWKSVISKPLVYTFLIKLLGLHDDRQEKAQLRSQMKNDKECPLYIGEPSIDIFARYIIYAGIPFMVIVICPMAFSLLNIL